MSWERQLVDLFEDLEQQAAGLGLAARDADVAELERAEYAGVDLAARLHASVGADVRLTVLGAGSVSGRVARVGSGWLLLAPEGRPPGGGPGGEVLVAVPALCAARGLSPRAVPAELRSPVTRLGLASVLRRIAEEQQVVEMVRRDGSTARGRVARVGADFVEVVDPGDSAAGQVVVTFRSVAGVRRA